MKKSIFIISCFSALIIYACSSIEMNNQENEANINFTEFIYSVYDPLTLNTFEQTNYLLEDHKITSSIYYRNSSNTTLTNTYIYLNDKISEIITYENNQVIKETNYNYDNSGNLVEYISKYNETDTLQLSYDKHTFNHTQDTIFVERKKSLDGINYDTQISTMKMILDENNNRVYFEAFDYIHNEQINIIKNTYDTNNNMIVEETSTQFEDGSASIISLDTYGYNTSINTLEVIYQKTFGRKNSMLLYHLEPQLLFNFNPRFISPNSINAFTSNSINIEAFPVEFENTLNNDGYSILDDFIVYSSNSTDYFHKFTLEYISE
ncbi:hypothetical protein [uncultured Psychroserpens sp.]|uniref:hypothetical protein n=1 Tax=uncultured Psychroserpens sp. TaxID=255436 RepID=UPI0026097660|nr:hypothetical protein [uncultured Psychroserpens sp.]